MAWKGLSHGFEKDLPVDADTSRVTLLEGSTAASLTGVLKLHKRGFFRGGDQVACVLTGNGLKDPDCAMSGITAPVSLKADKDIVARHISAVWRG